MLVLVLGARQPMQGVSSLMLKVTLYELLQTS